MTTPVAERPEPTYNMDSSNLSPPSHRQRSSDEDNTVVGEPLSQQHSPSHDHTETHQGTRTRSGTHLTVETAHDIHYMKSMSSPSQTREQASRLNDDLALLAIEQELAAHAALDRNQSTGQSMSRVRSRRENLVDEFDAATNPIHEQAAKYTGPENPTTRFSKFIKKIHGSSWLVRYLTYITPLVILILIPLLLGVLLFKDANVGGVKLSWFSIWLMIVWLTLWAGRVRPLSLSLSLSPISSKQPHCNAG